MTSSEKKRKLALFRLKQAQETLDEANLLLESGKSPRSIISRAYYAMFYSTLALLVFENYSTSKHSGVVSYFNKNFIKRGVLPKELGRYITKAFDLRQFGDYKEYSELSYDEIKPFIPKTEEFIQTVRDYLQKNSSI